MLCKLKPAFPQERQTYEAKLLTHQQEIHALYNANTELKAQAESTGGAGTEMLLQELNESKAELDKLMGTVVIAHQTCQTLANEKVLDL